MMNTDEIISRLASLEVLGDNWDTYGAEPITTWALSAARAIFTHSDTTQPVGIYPSADGGLDIEYTDDLFIHIPPSAITED